MFGPRQKYVPLDILYMCRFQVGFPVDDYIQDLQTAQEIGRRRRRTSSAVISPFVQMLPGLPR